jgi:pimeloyl-ACP methyl ester carboxylesterase
MHTCGRPRSVGLKDRAAQVWTWGGAGRPPLLLLHSLAAHSHWWDWVAPRLALRHDVVALDARGHGGSDRAHSYHFDDYVADIVAAMDALDIRAATVAGHSMGGYVGALLAARHPERVQALVIADILTGWSPALEEFASKQAHREPPTFASRDEAGARFRLGPPETTAPPARLRHLGETGVVERAPGAWHFAFDPGVFLHPSPDPWPFLGAIRCPTLVVRGERSPVMDREACAAVAKAIPRGQAAELAGAFHHLVVDDPDGFATLLDDWDATP